MARQCNGGPVLRGAPRAMHKTPRHAHPEHRQAAGAVLPPRETERASDRACPPTTMLPCAGPAALQDWTARAYAAGRPTSGGGPPARPRFFPFLQCVNVERFATAARSSHRVGSNMCCTRDSELSAVRVFDARAAAAAAVTALCR